MLYGASNYKNMEIWKHFSRALKNILSEECNTSMKLLNTKDNTYLPSLEIPVND